MRPRVILFLVLLAAGAKAGTASPPSPLRSNASPGHEINPPASARLRWINGESIPGELVGASSAGLTWKTPLFEDPLKVAWHVLRRIDQSQSPAPLVDSFSISLRDGSHIFGDLVALSQDAIWIHSARHGDALLKRAEVLAIRRVKGGKLVEAGPRGDADWKPWKTQNDENETGYAGTPEKLSLGPGGALSLPYWNTGATRDLSLPAFADIEFRVHSSRRPDFRLSLEGVARQRVRIETWDDELVLTAADQFKSIRKLARDERDVALRICWDRKGRKCSVFTPSGKLLTAWDVPDDSSSAGSTQILENKGRDLMLDFLKVRAWDGQPPQGVDGTLPHIEFADGRIVEGEVISGFADSLMFRTVWCGTEINFPLNEVDALVFSADQPKVTPGNSTLAYADGTILMGSVLSIEAGRASMQTSFTEGPFTAELGALRHFVINVPVPEGTPPQPSFAGMDKLVIQDSTLHGKMSCPGQGWPGWLAVGALDPSRPARAFPTTITRAFPPDSEIPNPPALLYTNRGDVLSGTLRALDQSNVDFDSSLVEITRLSAGDLDALQFGGITRMSVKGFNDPGWMILKGDEKSVQRSEGALAMEPETALCHPLAMQCSEIKFNIMPGGFPTVRLRLFCSGTDGTKSSNLIVMDQGGRITSGLELAEGGQLGGQNQMTVLSPGQPVPIRIVTDEKHVMLYVADTLAQTLAISSSKRPGSGLIIEPAGLWGNTGNPISLSGFSATSLPGSTSLPLISSETRTQALTVPRFRKDDPPRHALLAANGDVLRGEIDAATATHFAFRSGLENLSVPRERVKAAIWLKKPVENSSQAPADKSFVAKRLDDALEIQTTYNGSLSNVISFIEQQSGDLKFKLPEKRDSRSMTISFRGQSIGDLLDEICSQLDLHYRIDGTNTVAIEPNSNGAVLTGFVTKAYWLKSGAFPENSSAQQILVGKGIRFPAGSAATWQPNGALLSMTNTEENHTKLVEILDAGYGGNLGSPSYWILLTNGARLGISVDQFGPDFILGHHPVYGRCRVPMTDVYKISSAMPEPSVTMKSLQDWRLVFAPEPVLPESGGESSPILGKEAATFKLTLLGGGSFDLAKEKGNIVVLDFWATWCGPCIKSIPGLIDAMAAFPPDRVKLIGINQSEPNDQVKRFLETRGWKFTVAMDAGQAVSQKYGAAQIPHTVIVGPDGKVAWVRTGYTAEGDTEAATEVKKLLNHTEVTPAPGREAAQ